MFDAGNWIGYKSYWLTISIYSNKAIPQLMGIAFHNGNAVFFKLAYPGKGQLEAVSKNIVRSMKLFEFIFNRMLAGIKNCNEKNSMFIKLVIKPIMFCNGNTSYITVTG